MVFDLAYLERAKAISLPPPPGSPYSIPLVGTEQSDRSPVYRHWNFQHELLLSIDPHVCHLHLTLLDTSNTDTMTRS